MQSPCNLHLAGRAVAARKKKIKKKSRQDPSGQWKQRTLVNDACAPPESIMLDAKRGDKSPPPRCLLARGGNVHFRSFSFSFPLESGFHRNPLVWAAVMFISFSYRSAVS